MTTREFVLALLASGEARRMRLEHGLTQADLARLVGATKGSVCRWEVGTRFPSQAASLKYGELLAAWLRAGAGDFGGARVILHQSVRPRLAARRQSAVRRPSRMTELKLRPWIQIRRGNTDSSGRAVHSGFPLPGPEQPSTSSGDLNSRRSLTRAPGLRLGGRSSAAGAGRLSGRPAPFFFPTLRAGVRRPVQPGLEPPGGGPAIPAPRANPLAPRLKATTA